jgi:hypothetical protein
MHMPHDELLKSLKSLSSTELEELLRERQADDKALKILWRAAIARERASRKLAKEAARGS